MILAVDPGLTGALVLRGAGVFMHWRMPTYTKAAGPRNTERKFLYEPGVCEIVLAARLMGAEHAVIEDVFGVPGQSASGAFTFGYGAGVVVTACRLNDLTIDKVRPDRWKQAMRVPRDKRASRARASELMPEQSHLWTKAGDDGIAEAAMLALYAEKHL